MFNIHLIISIFYFYVFCEMQSLCARAYVYEIVGSLLLVPYNNEGVVHSLVSTHQFEHSFLLTC